MLTKEQNEQLYEAILRTFDESSLKRLLAFRFDKELEVIADGKGSFAEIVFNVMRVARMEGWTEALIAELHKERPNEPVFCTLAENRLADANNHEERKDVLIDEIDEPKERTQINTWWGIGGVVVVGVLLFVVWRFGGDFGDSIGVSPKRHIVGAHAMMEIPAGAFIMGSTDEQIEAGVALCDEVRREEGACTLVCCEDEAPVRTVTLRTYLIDEFPVTNEMYRACMDAEQCTPPKNLDPFENDKRGDHPVVFVTWKQAAAYCSAQELRLPTEAEWEKAARGVDGVIYPWGNEFEPERLNSCDVQCDFSSYRHDYNDGFRETSPVGQFDEGDSLYGVGDMAGNVWEWTADWYAPYDEDEVVNPFGTADGEFKAVRGGSFGSAANGVRSTDRLQHRPEEANNELGFRCVMSDV